MSKVGRENLSPFNPRTIPLEIHVPFRTTPARTVPIRITGNQNLRFNIPIPAKTHTVNARWSARSGDTIYSGVAETHDPGYPGTVNAYMYPHRIPPLLRQGGIGVEIIDRINTKPIYPKLTSLSVRKPTGGFFTNGLSFDWSGEIELATEESGIIEKTLGTTEYGNLIIRTEANSAGGLSYFMFYVLHELPEGGVSYVALNRNQQQSGASNSFSLGFRITDTQLGQHFLDELANDNFVDASFIYDWVADATSSEYSETYPIITESKQTNITVPVDTWLPPSYTESHSNTYPMMYVRNNVITPPAEAPALPDITITCKPAIW
jgi:hypothetical protein